MRFSFREFAIGVADTVDDATLQIADVARNFYCTMYNDTPAWVLRGNRLVSPVARRALESLCGSPLPPPPPPGRDGEGQCGVEYEIRGKATYKGRDVSGYVCDAEINFRVLQTFTGYLRGFIVDPFVEGSEIRCGVEFESLSGEILEAKGAIVSNDGNNGVSSGRLDWRNSCTYSGFSLGANDIRDMYVTRVDGLPDNCVIPPGYPEVPPPAPSDLSIQVEIETNVGDTVLYDVNINPDPDGYPSFPPVINVSGIAVDFDVTGIGVGEVNISRRSGGGGNGSGGTGSDTTGGEPEVETELPKEESAPETVQEGVEEEVEGLVAIKVDVTSIPSNAKVVWANGNQRLIYAGWVNFVIDGKYFPREWIDHDANYFPAPDGATGYAVTLKTGFTASVVEVTESQE